MLRQTAAGGRWLRGKLFGGAAGSTAATDTATAEYATTLAGALARWDDLHAWWLAQADEQRQNERLANAAAVYRWHLNAVREVVAAAHPPRHFGAWHEGLLGALDAAYRGTRLLAQGYRFSHLRPICDGGLLLDEARAQGVAVRAALAPLLPVAADAEAGLAANAEAG